MDEQRRERLRQIGDRALADVIDRYRRAGRHEGGPFSLAELLSEQHDRQKVGAFETVATARAILAQATASDDGLTTYGAIWTAFRPGEPWRLFPGRGEVTNALERVQHYCVRNGLPLLATLVVNAGERELTTDAKANIVRWAIENGMDIGADADQFILDQQRRARSVGAATLR